MTKKISIGIVLVLAVVYFLPYMFVPHKTVLAPAPVDTTIVTPLGICTGHTQGQVTLYSRPSTKSSVFGIADPSQNLQFVGKTEDASFYGFEPGTAQAANVGPFRLRYVRATDIIFDEKSDCSRVSVVPTVLATACYVMFQEGGVVRSAPTTSSDVGTSFYSGDYIPVIAQTSGSTYWMHVKSGVSDSSIIADGWVSGTYANFSGASCEKIPIVKK